MSASHAPALDAIAFQLAAALEEYEHAADAMVNEWPDQDRYRTVSSQIETIRMYTSALPELRVPWVELLISHAELVHMLWKGHYGGGFPEPLEAVCERHSYAMASLRSRCMRLLERRDAA
jgi:hypothetical protein